MPWCLVMSFEHASRAVAHAFDAAEEVASARREGGWPTVSRVVGMLDQALDLHRDLVRRQVREGAPHDVELDARAKRARGHVDAILSAWPKG